MNTQFLRRPAFLLAFVLPNLIAIVYFGLIASPVYTSRASLTVLNPSRSASNLTSMLSGGSGDGSAEGGFILKDYLGSWDEFRSIEPVLDPAQHYALGDPVSRYGGLITAFRRNDIALWRYLKRQVNVTIDPKSGIATLEVRAYSPAFAQRLASTLLKDAVGRMNQMNAAQERDVLASAEAKKAGLLKAFDDDEALLARYRAKVGVYDPKEQSASDLGLVNSLEMRVSELKAQHASILKATPNSPELQNLETAMAAVQLRITATRSQVADLGRDSETYDGLVARRDNDLNLLQQANLADQDARQKGLQNRYYLDVISQPSLPNTPELPRRLLSIVGVFLATLVLWGLLR
jgi:capsular polysaccharide transport system permease protein